MSGSRAFEQGIAAVLRLRDAADHASALAKVEEMRKAWPGNARLCILWSDLAQLQEEMEHLSTTPIRQALGMRGVRSENAIARRGRNA